MNRKRNPWGAALLLILAIAIALAFLTFFRAGFGIGGAIVLSLVSLCVIKARQMLLTPKEISDVLKNDKALVLYLRSFQDDTAGYTRRVHLSPFDAFDPYTYDQRISAAFAPNYQFVAVGRPSESHPELGAERVYLSDDEWKAKVEQLMGLAKLVIIFVGTTPGLLWEIETVLKLPALPRVAFFIPPVDRADKDKRAQSFANLRLSLPSEWPPGTENAIFVYLAEDRAPHPMIPDISFLERCVTFNTKSYRMQVALSALVRNPACGLLQPRVLLGDKWVRRALVWGAAASWLAAIGFIIYVTVQP